MVEQLKNSDPELLRNAFSLIGTLLSDYGWNILIIVIVSYFIWKRFLKEKVRQWKDQWQYNHCDENQVSERLLAMDAARRRMQQEYDAKLAEVKDNQNNKDNEKLRKREEIQKIAENKDNDLKRRTVKSLRDEGFNPLMGHSSSSSYRPSRACGPSGGG